MQNILRQFGVRLGAVGEAESAEGTLEQYDKVREYFKISSLGDTNDFNQWRLGGGWWRAEGN